MGSIFEINPPVLRVPELREIWANHRPEISPLFQALGPREPWVVPATSEDPVFPDQLADILQRLSSREDPGEETFQELAGALAYFSAEQSIYAIAWLNEHSEHAPRLMSWLLDHQEEGVAHALLHRIQVVARHQVLNDLITAAGERPLGRLA